MKMLFTLLSLVLIQHAYGQTEICQKIGFANMQVIAQAMPETRQMEKELNSFGGQLRNQLNEKYSAYQKQVYDFGNLSGTIAEEEIKTRREAIVRLEEEIRKFSDDAEKIFMQKQEELMRPIMLKIDRSINEVATEHNYSIIVNTELPAGQRLILFGAKTYDVSDLVLKKMGLAVNQNKR